MNGYFSEDLAYYYFHDVRLPVEWSSRRKNMALITYKTGCVTLGLPKKIYVAPEAIDRFLASHLDKLKFRQEKYKVNAYLTGILSIKECTFLDNDLVYIFGMPYLVKIDYHSQSKVGYVEEDPSPLILGYFPQGSTRYAVKHRALARAGYYGSTLEVLGKLYQYYEEQLYMPLRNLLNPAFIELALDAMTDEPLNAALEDLYFSNIDRAFSQKYINAIPQALDAFVSSLKDGQIPTHNLVNNFIYSIMGEFSNDEIVDRFNEIMEILKKKDKEGFNFFLNFYKYFGAASSSALCKEERNLIQTCINLFFKDNEALRRYVLHKEARGWQEFALNENIRRILTVPLNEIFQAFYYHFEAQEKLTSYCVKDVLNDTSLDRKEVAPMLVTEIYKEGYSSYTKEQKKYLMRQQFFGNPTFRFSTEPWRWETTFIDWHGNEIDPALAVMAYPPLFLPNFNAITKDSVTAARKHIIPHARSAHYVARGELIEPYSINKMLVKPGVIRLRIEQKAGITDFAARKLYFETTVSFILEKTVNQILEILKDDEEVKEIVKDRWFLPQAKFCNMSPLATCGLHGELVVNVKLARLPVIQLLAVLCHEAVHLRYFNHGKHFKRSLEFILPKEKAIYQTVIEAGVPETYMDTIDLELLTEVL